jgi:hypothetical protein
LLTTRPVRAVIGGAVFVLGVLAGAGIAAWMVPPVSRVTDAFPARHRSTYAALVTGHGAHD